MEILARQAELAEIERLLGASERAAAVEVLEAAARLQAATAASAVRYLSSTLLPEDETCFCHLEGPSSEAVAAAYERARLPFARIARATLVPAALNAR